MILVTGAMGRIGTATVQAARSRDVPVRAMVPALRRVPWLVEHGAHLVEGDYDDGRRLGEALDGVEVVVLIARPGAEHVAMQERVIDACRSSGVQRIVKLSVAGAAPDAVSDAARWHWRTEQHLRHAGIEGVVVRAGRTMQDLLLQAPLLIAHQMLVHCQGDGVAADVDARDVGRVLAALALATALPAEPLVVTGPELLTRADVAGVASHVLGRPIRAVPCTPDDLRQVLLGAGVSRWQVDDLVAFEVAARDGHCATLTNVVREWTGAEPVHFARFGDEMGQSLRYANAPEPGPMVPLGGAT